MNCNTTHYRANSSSVPGDPTGLAVRWRPFLLGPIFKTFGWDTSPFLLQPAKANYLWIDLERECRKAGIAWRKPTAFPRPALLPLRVALLGAEQEWMAEYCRRIMSLNFAEDRDIDRPEPVTQVLEQLGLDAPAILAAAQSADNKLALREQTELARHKGIFGAPTFFVGDEMFWGNDRLDDAIAAAQQLASPPPRNARADPHAP